VLQVVQALPQGSVQSASFSESLPWFAKKGVSFEYSISGSYYVVNQLVNYTGYVEIKVVSVNPNLSLTVLSNTSVSNPFVSQGVHLDDSFFPAILLVLPEQMVIPRSFSVVTRSYAVFFDYLGNFSGDYEYKITESVGGIGASPITKIAVVDPKNGVFLSYKVENSYTKAYFAMKLLSYNASASTQKVSVNAPVFARPGSTLVYTTAGSIAETLNYTTLFCEPDGLFYFEKSNVIQGKLQGPAFFLDNYTQTAFYPAVSSFSQDVNFGVSIGSIGTATLSYLGETSVQTVYGKVDAYAYANRTIGFEAYLNPQTGVAVYIELPGGTIDLSSSNFVPLVSPSFSIFPIVSLVLFVIFVFLFLPFVFRKRR